MDSIVQLQPVITIADQEIIIPGMAEIVRDKWIHESEVDFSLISEYESIWEKADNGKWRTIFKKMVVK